MDREDFLDGCYALLDTHNAFQALKSIGKEALDREAIGLLKADISTEEKRERFILNKAKYEGMAAMLNSIIEELEALNKKRG